MFTIPVFVDGKAASVAVNLRNESRPWRAFDAEARTRKGDLVSPRMPGQSWEKMGNSRQNDDPSGVMGVIGQLMVMIDAGFAIVAAMAVMSMPFVAGMADYEVFHCGDVLKRARIMARTADAGC